jgi:hypothetical protein
MKTRFFFAAVFFFIVGVFSVNAKEWSALKIINAARVDETPAAPQLGEPTVLQKTLNLLPEIPVGLNTLKFEFGGDMWIAKNFGRNFMGGTLSIQDTDKGAILTLKQTHIYSQKYNQGIGWIRTPEREIVLEYKPKPPAPINQTSLSKQTAKADTPETTAMNSEKLTFGVNANPGGAVREGPSLSLEFNKGKFYSQVDFILPFLGMNSAADFGFGALATFNYFNGTDKGGYYFGGGAGVIYETYKSFNAFILTGGLNAGYKFVMASGLFFRTGAFLGAGYNGHSGDMALYIKPDTAVGYSF